MNRAIYYDAEFPLEEYQDADLFWKVRKLLPISSRNLTEMSLVAMTKEPRIWGEFQKAITFITENIDGDFDVLGLGLLSNEIQILLFRSFYLSSIAFYKEAFFNLRAALEISLFLSSEYVLEGKSTQEEDFFSAFEKRRKDVSDWLNSKRSTPYRDRMRKILVGQKLIERLFSETAFEEQLKAVCAQLNSYIHTNGIAYTNLHIHRDSGNPENPPTTNPSVFQVYLARFVDITILIAVITAATRPQLLDETLSARLIEATNEIPIGLWGQATGNFFALVPESYREFFEEYWIKVDRRQC